jgi:4-nitrophenyl phosphatase
MIGDNLDTDIQFGLNGKIDTLCVLTGNSNEEMVLKSNLSSYYADFLM